MHKDNGKFKQKLSVDKSALGIVSIENVTVLRPQQKDILAATNYLPEAVTDETPEKWWRKYFTAPIVVIGNYQRKREVLAGF